MVTAGLRPCQGRANSARTAAHEARAAPCTPLQPQLLPAPLSVLWGRIVGPFRGVTACTHCSTHPSLPLWQLRCAHHRCTRTSDLSCSLLAKVTQHLEKGCSSTCHFLQLEKPSEWEDAGGEFCSLEQEEPSSKPQLAGKGLPSQGQRESNSNKAAQGEDEESPQVLGCPEKGDLEQGTAELDTSTFRAQLSHELRPPGLS